MSIFNQFRNVFAGSSADDRKRALDQRLQEEDRRRTREIEEMEARKMAEYTQYLEKRNLAEVQWVVGKGAQKPVAAPQTARFKKAVSL